MKSRIIFTTLLVSGIVLISACTSSNNDNKVTDTPTITEVETTDTPTPTEPEVTEAIKPTEPEVTDAPTPTEPEITETPIPTEPETTEIPVNTEGEEGMPIGKWYDKNGSTVIEFVGNKMYATWWSGMETPEEFEVAIEKTGDVTYIYNASGEYGKSFGIMSQLEVREDGCLYAYEEILDGESHSYKFVPEDKIEEERAVKDFSTDMPKTIESREIKSFVLCLNHYNIEGLGEGTYSWEIKKNSEGKYESTFDGMGPSYVIIRYSQEVDDAFMEGVLKLLDEENVAENNGLFFSHDENDSEYDLYVRFESRERITIKVGSKALDKWPIDNEKFIEYAMSIIPEEELNR